MRVLRIAILGDVVRDYAKHTMIGPGLEAAAGDAEVPVAAEWVPTTSLSSDPAMLESFDGAVVAPQSAEYCRDVEALLGGLTFVRESGLCCLATCGGAQYALSEQADSAGEAAALSLFREVACELPGDGGYRVSGRRAVRIRPGTRAASAYARLDVEEQFACNRVLDDPAVASLRRRGVVPSGVTPDVGATIFEWTNHPFYVATLFLPHWSPEQPHPLFAALLSAARDRVDRMSHSAPSTSVRRPRGLLQQTPQPLL